MQTLNTVTKTLVDWINWTQSDVRDEWNTWEEWQRCQPATHYERSDIFQYYLLHRHNFVPPRNSCLVGCNAEYYVYCFGDFASPLVTPHSNGDILEYIRLLLDVYDVCKGIRRRLRVKGDPSGISILRRAVVTQTLDTLKACDFTVYDYPYERIHAHTVAQYSLSTLIMRLVSHHLNQTAPKGLYPSILISKCKEALDNHNFGIPAITTSGNLPQIPVISPSIPIVQPIKTRLDEIKGCSWPRGAPTLHLARDPSKCLRCKVCSRVAENLWGEFNACLDCHIKRICSICGAPAVIITPEGLPKCHAHQPSN